MEKNHKYIKQSPFSAFALFGLSAFFLLFILYLYYQRAVSFSFVDEFNNIVTGYYLLQGRVLLTQIFFNHNPLMAYISFVIQYFLHPDSMYKLILYHRFFISVFAIVWEIWFIIRFRWIGFLFALVFELSKYYSFGNLFLAESLVVYPCVYLLLLNFYQFDKKQVFRYEIIFSGVLTWFMFWLREPYVPLILFLYASLLFFTKYHKERFLSVALFLLLSSVVLLTMNDQEYIAQVITLNTTAVAQKELASSGLQGIGILQIFFYPVIIFLQGHWNIFRLFTEGLSSFFIISFALYLLKSRNVWLFLFLVFTLGLGAIRMDLPGTTFYAAYHMNIWYGLFISSIVWCLSWVYTEKTTRLFGKILLGIFLLFTFFIFVMQNSYLHDSVDRQHDFTVAYARYANYGSLIATLAPQNSTVFVDSWDSLIYWQAKLPVAYEYVYFYPPMVGQKPYEKKRLTMFQNNPPTFYYSYCGENYSGGIPNFRKKDYGELFSNGSPACLFIYKPKVNEISSKQWQKVHDLGYYLKD